MAAQFGTFSKDRPGFEKVFHGLSDKAWNNGISMIKEAAKRGYKFTDIATTFNKQRTFNLKTLNEIKAMQEAASVEKKLLEDANDSHRHYSHAVKDNHPGKDYDAGIAHHLEEYIENKQHWEIMKEGY